MKISEMTRGDIPALAALEADCFSEPWSEQAFLDTLESPTAFFLVAADENGAVLGYGGMHTVQGESYITNIAVSPDCRRQGVGRALLTALTARAAENGGRFITLEVRVSNTAAIALYAALGFARAGIRPRFYTRPTEDALLMTRTFADTK